METTVVFLTGGAAAAAAGAMGLEGFGAAVATTTVTGTVGGATEAGLYSALMGNDANTVTEDAIKGGVLGGAIGAVTGGVGYGAKHILNSIGYNGSYGNLGSASTELASNGRTVGETIGILNEGNSGTIIKDNCYIPIENDGTPIPLLKQNVNGQDIPLPDVAAQGRPHTVLGGKSSTKTGEIYRQSATFPKGTWPKANGEDVPWSEVHWTDHGTPEYHSNPHQHIFEYKPDKGGWIRSAPQLYNP